MQPLIDSAARPSITPCSFDVLVTVPGAMNNGDAPGVVGTPRVNAIHPFCMQSELPKPFSTVQSLTAHCFTAADSAEFSSAPIPVPTDPVDRENAKQAQLSDVLPAVGVVLDAVM